MRRVGVLLAVGIGAIALPFGAFAAKPPKKPKPPKTPSTPLSLVAKPEPVTYGGGVNLTGRLRGSGHANKPVLLQRNPYPFRGFRNVRVVRTDAQGDYKFFVRPRLHTRYRTVTPAPATIYDTVVRSPEVLEHVRLRVSIRLSDSTPARGTRVRFRGFVAPRHNGRRVFIQRRRSDGRWLTVARTLTRNATRNRSRYSKRVRIFRNGAFRVRVRGHADHRTGTSRVRAIRVH